ncbi:unnamed protein product [Linum tenue]|uniref:Uncharacterized protein n=1 Tax=Linum tenue TaxID=586396 RepID=A0AAV0IBQ3_9ROSI|nr:unnamed protein product [Linum tenue]
MQAAGTGCGSTWSGDGSWS